MVMARFCARVRKRPRPAVGVDAGRLPAPDIRSLATALGTAPRDRRPATSRHPRSAARGGAGRRRGHRARVGRQPLLRRPGRRLDGMARFCARVRKRADLPSVSMPGRLPRTRRSASLATALAAAGRTPPHRRAAVTPPSARARRPPAGHRWVHPLRDAAAPVLPRLRLPRRVHPDQGLRVDLRRHRTWSTSTCGRRCSARRSSSACCTFRSWRSGCSSALAEAPADPRSGAWATCASGSSRPWCARTRWSLFVGSPLYVLYLQGAGREDRPRVS